MSKPATNEAEQKGEKSDVQPRAFTIGHTLKMLPISRSHLYSLALKGEVRLIKVGNRTLLPASELERLLSGGSAQ
jgi:hypothetical protein